MDSDIFCKVTVVHLLLYSNICCFCTAKVAGNFSSSRICCKYTIGYSRGSRIYLYSSIIYGTIFVPGSHNYHELTHKRLTTIHEQRSLQACYKATLTAVWYTYISYYHKVGVHIIPVSHRSYLLDPLGIFCKS